MISVFNVCLGIGLIILWCFKPEVFYRRERDPDDPDVAGLSFQQNDSNQRSRHHRRRRRANNEDRTNENHNNENEEVSEAHLYAPDDDEVPNAYNEGEEREGPYVPTAPDFNQQNQQEVLNDYVSPYQNPYNPYDEDNNDFN